MIKGVVIAGTHSGVGKTTLTIGLLASLKRRGYRVVPFKIGPDFIDPGHHAAISGGDSRNLDGWMLTRSYNRSCFARCSRKGDLAVVEGVMGLFDGFSGSDPAGSTAEMAKWLGLPIVLVVDAAGMAGSVAALVQGFERYDPGLSFAGVVFNNVGGPSHLQFLEAALEENVDMPSLGGLLRNDDFSIPERHLGLMMAHERHLSEQFIGRLAEQIETQLDLDTLLNRLSPVEPMVPAAEQATALVSSPTRIGVAQDEAFCFYYQDNLDILVGAGAELVPFSPLEDGDLPDHIGGLYLGGGYPELFAEKLAENQSMRSAIRSWSRDGMPIYGECGGFMYLCRDLADTNGRVYPMTGCFPFGTRMQDRLSSLGYREVLLEAETLLGNPGIRIKGHEYHYSDLEASAQTASFARKYRLVNRHGRGGRKEGFQLYQTLGSYVHLHFGSCPQAAGCFVENCRAFLSGKTKHG